MSIKTYFQTALACIGLGGFVSPTYADDAMLIIGLGNPGAEYENQRHNVGFMAVDAIAAACKAGPFKSKFDGEWAQASIADGQKIYLLKPMTYMNESGQSVGQMARFFKIPLDNIIVIHDELDLDAGQIKIKTGGGHAGHNGLRSIDAHLGSANYKRLRIGIGHPGDKSRVTGHVLGDFSKQDQIWLPNMLAGLAENVNWLIKNDDSKFIEKVKKYGL